LDLNPRKFSERGLLFITVVKTRYESHSIGAARARRPTSINLLVLDQELSSPQPLMLWVWSKFLLHSSTCREFPFAVGGVRICQDYLSLNPLMSGGEPAPFFPFFLTLLAEWHSTFIPHLQKFEFCFFIFIFLYIYFCNRFGVRDINLIFWEILSKLNINFISTLSSCR